MFVTLGEGPSGVEDFSGARKNGSSFQDISAAGGGVAGRGGGAGGAGAPCLGEVLKNWVKPPSADAESDAPGEENPFDFDGLGDGGAGRGVSSGGRAVGVNAGVPPETMMRVNSPGPGSAGCGAFSTWVGASFGGADGGAGRCPKELNICVNSPGAPG